MDCWRAIPSSDRIEIPGPPGRFSPADRERPTTSCFSPALVPLARRLAGPLAKEKYPTSFLPFRSCILVCQGQACLGSAVTSWPRVFNTLWNEAAQSWTLAKVRLVISLMEYVDVLWWSQRMKSHARVNCKFNLHSSLS